MSDRLILAKDGNWIYDHYCWLRTDQSPEFWHFFEWYSSLCYLTSLEIPIQLYQRF